MLLEGKTIGEIISALEGHTDSAFVESDISFRYSAKSCMDEAMSWPLNASPAIELIPGGNEGYNIEIGCRPFAGHGKMVVCWINTKSEDKDFVFALHRVIWEAMWGNYC